MEFQKSLKIMDFILVFSTISTAFLLSLSHCVFMCGGFALLLGKLTASKSKGAKTLYLLLYHLGRISAYCVLGSVFAYFGAGAIKNASTKGFVFFFLGVFIVILAFSLQFRGKILEFLENSKLQNFILRLAGKLSKERYIVVLGFLNGLMPCGVVYYFLALSFSAGSLAPFIMLLAGLATLPTLLFYSFVAGFLSVKYRKIAGILGNFIIAIYGIYLSYKGFLLL